MSGFEVAGIVLGSIPILLASLKLGGEAVQSTRRLFGYKAVINRYRTILAAEAAIYRNVLTLLLREVTSPKQLETLLNDSDHQLWKDKDFVERLKDKKLGESYDPVIGIMREMDTTIHEFSEKIGAPQVNLANSKGQGKRLVVKIIAYQSTLDGLVHDLAGHNRRLEALAKMAVPVRTSSRASKLASSLETFRLQAMALYRAVKATLTCICLEHEAAILLDSSSKTSATSYPMLWGRDTALANAAPEWCTVVAELLPGVVEAPIVVQCKQPTAKGKGKKVAFHDPNAVVTAVATSTVLPPAVSTAIHVPIPDFCQHLRNIQMTQSISGKIADVNSVFTIAMPATPVFGSGHVLSLQSWLCGRSNTVHFSLRDRLSLAVSISTAVVSLAQTPWFPVYPREDHILMLKAKSAASAQIGLKASLRSGPPITSTEAAPRFVKHPTFFMLGILLIELIFAKPIDRLHDLINYRPSDQCSRWEQLYDIADIMNSALSVQSTARPSASRPNSSLACGDAKACHRLHEDFDQHV